MLICLRESGGKRGSRSGDGDRHSAYFLCIYLSESHVIFNKVSAFLMFSIRQAKKGEARVERAPPDDLHDPYIRSCERPKFWNHVYGHAVLYTYSRRFTTHIFITIL
jgi:hypothetical protein